MWACPVCDYTNTDNICTKCGFDHSTDYMQFYTLHKPLPQTATISELRNTFMAKNLVSVCKCCGGTVISNSCIYCGFSLDDDALLIAPEALHLRAAAHAEKIIASLTDFSIVAYRYTWEPKRSRLELQSEEIIPLGDAQDFYQNIAWANREFGQLRNGTGTELHLAITYYHNGRKKILNCTIPTVKSDRSWRFGIFLDASLHLKLYLGSGKKYIKTAPIALDLS